MYVRPPPFPLRPTPPMRTPLDRDVRRRRLGFFRPRWPRGRPTATAGRRMLWPWGHCLVCSDAGRTAASAAVWRVLGRRGGAPHDVLVGPCLFGSLDTWRPQGVHAACSGGCWRPQTARNQVHPPTRANRGRPPHQRWFGGGLCSGPSQVWLGGGGDEIVGLSGSASSRSGAAAGGSRGGWKRLLVLVAADIERVGVIRSGRRTERTDVVQQGACVG